MSYFYTVSGSFKNLFSFLRSMEAQEPYQYLRRYGDEGVRALSSTTPHRTGYTAGSWYYVIEDLGGIYKISWHNSHVNQGYNIAVLLQYGHGTGTGGYVVGRDYINPAIQPVFDNIVDKVWRGVTSA